MAAGRKMRRKCQIGKESSAGTAVAATTIWRGPVTTISDDRVIKEVEEHVGILGGTDRDYIASLFATLEMPATEATFEQLPYLLAASMGGNTSGVADGTGSTGFLYTGTIPTTSNPTGVFYTIETGDDFEVEEMEYSHVVEFTLSGRGDEAWMMASKWQGRQSTKSSFTAALSVPTVEEILGGKTKLYVDAIGGTIGTTQITNQLLGWTITFKFFWKPKHTADNALYFSFPQFTGYEITGELTVEHDTFTTGASGGTREHFRSRTARLMRLQAEGAAYGTAGSGTLNSGKKTLRIDLPVKWGNHSVLEDEDGNDILKIPFRSRYNTTAATAGSIVVANELAALT